MVIWVFMALPKGNCVRFFVSLCGSYFREVSSGLIIFLIVLKEGFLNDSLAAHVSLVRLSLSDSIRCTCRLSAHTSSNGKTDSSFAHSTKLIGVYSNPIGYFSCFASTITNGQTNRAICLTWLWQHRDFSCHTICGEIHLLGGHVPYLNSPLLGLLR